MEKLKIAYFFNNWKLFTIWVGKKFNTGLRWVLAEFDYGQGGFQLFFMGGSDEARKKNIRHKTAQASKRPIIRTTPVQPRLLQKYPPAVPETLDPR